MAALPPQNRQNRYLWVQFVGLAAVPLLLDVCLAGLASSRTTFGYPSAFGLQYWLIAVVCIVPSLAMQCLRPFYVFSVPPLALKPSVLSTNQRRCLRLLESWQIKALAVGSAGLSLWLLSQLYVRSPQITPIMKPNVGLMAAVIAFFWACTFLQISISSARLLLVGPEAMKRVTPYEPPAIAANFSILGLRVGKILPTPAGKVFPDPRQKRTTPSKSAREKTVEPQLDQAKASNAELRKTAETDIIAPVLTTSTVQKRPNLTDPDAVEQPAVSEYNAVEPDVADLDEIESDASGSDAPESDAPESDDVSTDEDALNDAQTEAQ